jgi:hemolysin activation/secretion protein
VSGAWSLKSSFNLGTGLFGGTFITVPNAGFFSWNGQVQRIQSVGADAFLIGSLDAQLSANPLLSSQQFVVGGANSVRGFRQNVRAGDNGIRASVEGRFTVLRNQSADRRAIIQLAPFVDVGAIWNNGQNPNPLPSQNFLAGGGLGIIIEPVQNLLLRVDATIPFVNLADRGNNLQESSVFFNIGYRF